MNRPVINRLVINCLVINRPVINCRVINCPRPLGSTYCALAILSMLGFLRDGSVLTRRQLEKLKRWLILKQRDGFHGRTNKLDDSCYAFWLGASLTVFSHLQESGYD